MKMDPSLLEQLDVTRVYCQRCLLEGQVEPLDPAGTSDEDPLVEIKCAHIGRNCNTLRFHDGEWHIFYGFRKVAKCRTCQAMKNLETMNDPDGPARAKLREWYKTDECRAMLRKNADRFRTSEAGKRLACENARKWRESSKFKEHGADGLRAYLKTDEFKRHIVQHNRLNCQRMNEIHIEWCGECQRNTPHNGYGTCMVCHPRSLTPSFVTLPSGEVLYVNKQLGLRVSIQDLVRRLDLPDGDPQHLDHRLLPHVDRRLGKWFFRDVSLDDGKRLLTYGANFVQTDAMWYFDRKMGDYVPWEEYRQSFLKQDWSADIQEFSKMVSGLVVPTFRKRSSEDWTGARAAFEQHLVELGVGHLVYVKFYEDQHNSVCPLVAGHTGSMLVNLSGTDVSFSTDVDDGPARRFLAELGLHWHVEGIVAIPCDSKEEAQSLEGEIIERFGLFGS